MKNQNFCKLVQDIPSGAKPHVWNMSYVGCVGGSRWQVKKRLSEKPFFLELYWRAEVNSEQNHRLGIFQLDLNGLLKNGYIRLEKTERYETPYVRIRIFKDDKDGHFYFQTKQHEPKLFISAGSPIPKETLEPPIDLSEPPARYKTQISRIIRDTPLAHKLKSLYGFACQMRNCNFRIEPAPNSFYIEVHHIRPLGGGHDGSDIQSNMLVLCPNHHAMFDYGIPCILSPERIEIAGTMHDLITKHELSPDSMEYHNKLRNRTA